MKSLLTGCLLLMLSTASFSQYTDSSAIKLTSGYLRKSNNQKTAGRILLGGRAGLTCIGIIAGASSVWTDILEGDSRRTNAAGAVILTVLAGMAGSIPLFIAAGKNRRKAADTVSFQLEKATLIYSCIASVNRYPVLGAHISL